MARILTAVAAAMVLSLAASAQGGSMLIDDFSGGLGSWITVPTGQAGAEVVPYAGNPDVLQLTAANSFTWQGSDDGWSLDQEALSGLWIAKPGLTVPDGTQFLTFQAAAIFVGDAATEEWNHPYVLVRIDYTTLLDGPATILEPITGPWAQKPITLTGIDTSAPLDLGFIIACNTSYPAEPIGQDTTWNVSTTAYVDNVAFATPEPATMLLLAAGLAGILRRRVR